MSGLLNKAKEAMGKGGSSGGSSGGQPSGMEKQGIDKATDSAGMGDKYDDDGQLNNQIPGGAGTKQGGAGQQGGL
ncbi:hypothetical protein LTR10_002514 [Elasticomyces elasticus]|nr:hypothetical protein LTR10_002514 [Elasticomyces elasticus]KAK4973426.1 hypothetical protein LTR42_005412 [Elasticomyces elasticus]